MTWDHERVEELLSGFVLDALDEDDRELAERALAEHVPGCARCREAFDAFREVAGDLALGAPPARPPEVLGARLRRETRQGPAFTGRRWGWVAAGVAVALIGGLGGWNVTLAGRLGDAETRQRWIVDAVGALGNPQAGVIPLEGDVQGRVHLLYAPGSHRMYLVASGMRRPERGVYHVWMRRGGKVWSGGTFVPREGVVMLRLEHEPGSLDQVMVTEEAAEDVPSPTASPLAQTEVLVVSPTPSPSPTVTPTSTPTG